VEVGQAVLALNVLANQLELLERPFGVLNNKLDMYKKGIHKL
jgi:hypothetical protein